MQFELEVSESSPEQLQLKLALLSYERERLRENGAARDLLERNRLEIGRYQYQYSRALVGRYLPQPVERAA
jgi:hypothetical protein